jgi:hypothetical protein
MWPDEFLYDDDDVDFWAAIAGAGVVPKRVPFWNRPPHNAGNAKARTKTTHDRSHLRSSFD